MEMLSEVGDLLGSQRLAVLATTGEAGPYSSLVAFAEKASLDCLLFATNRSSTKYRNIEANPSVSVLVDSRLNEESDFENAVAVTALGRAKEALGDARRQCTGVYLAKHPNLAAFVHSPGTALIEVTVDRYILAGFRETRTVDLR